MSRRGFSEEYINSIISKVASFCHIRNWNYTMREFESKAQNYFGVLIPVILTGESKKGQVSFHLVMKLAPTDDRFRVSGAVTVMFAKETYFYSSVLRQYYKLARKYSLSEYIAPKCYFVSREPGSEALVMQDMTFDGYRPFVECMFVNFDHIVVSLASLAQFHAYSFITKERNKNVYEEAIKVCQPVTRETHARFMQILQNRLDRALEKFAGTKYVPVLENLKVNCETFVEDVGRTERTCICHGDLWKENLLFKYQDGVPMSACLIDYQNACVASPAFDVLYLITSSTHANLRKTHFEQMLHIYYEKFSIALSEAKLAAEKLYPRKSFVFDLKIVGPACFIIANTALWLASGLQEDGHVRSARVWETEEEKALAVESYKTLIKALIDDFESYDYLCLCGNTECSHESTSCKQKQTTSTV